MNIYAYIPSRDVRNVNKHGSAGVPAKKVLDLVQSHFGLTLDDIMSVCRKRSIVYPRQVTMYLLAHYSALTVSSIGVIFNKDHTTVVHSLEAIDNWMLTDDKVKDQVCQLIKELTDGEKI